METMNIKVKFLLELVLKYTSNCKNVMNYRYNAGTYECEIRACENSSNLVTCRISREREPLWDLYHIEIIADQSTCVMNLMTDEMSSEERELVTKVYKRIACQEPCGINAVIRELLA